MSVEIITPACVIYERSLGFTEYADEFDDDISVFVCVVNCHFGYNVMRFGGELEHLKWYYDREDAIEYAVDYGRWEINRDEIEAQSGEPSP